MISSLAFKPYSADLTAAGAKAAINNQRILDRISVMLRKYPSFRVRIEAHTVLEHWSQPRKLREEEEQKLVAISKERAESVRQALSERGIPANRMTTAGMGAALPVMPHSDQAGSWKNRRVEFILLR